MASILVGLTIQHGVTGEIEVLGRKAEKRYSAPLVSATLIVTPDADPEATKIGKLRVTIESIDEPADHPPIPNLPPEEMKAWLVGILKSQM